MEFFEEMRHDVAKKSTARMPLPNLLGKMNNYFVQPRFVCNGWPGDSKAKKLILLGGAATCGFIVGVLLIRLVHVGFTAESSVQAPADRVFASDGGLVLNLIKPDKTAEFEAIVGRLHGALQTSERPERKSQAASWKVFRAAGQPGSESVLYVFVMDPAIKGGDYSVAKILEEAFPAEVERLYNQYVNAYAAGQNVVNLTPVSTLGQ
jgi:hypothetical protein